MKKNNPIFEFLIDDLGDNLLSFLRNLTPIILLFSMSIFVFSRFSHFSFAHANWGATFLGLGTLCLAIGAFIINCVLFARKCMRVFYELNEDEKNQKQPMSLVETIKIFWNKGGVKQIIIFYTIMLISLTVVIVSGCFTAFNMYKLFY